MKVELPLEDGSALAVFGYVLDGVQSMDAVLADGTMHHPLIFTGYDSRAQISAQYFVLFLPPDASGELIARYPNGDVAEKEGIGAEGERK